MIIRKYLRFVIELKKLWNMKVTIAISALSTETKSLLK